MKTFAVGFKVSDGIYSINMIYANTGRAEHLAVRETAERKAARHGYEIAYIRELANWEVEENAIVSLNSRKDRLNVAAYTEKSTVKLTATIQVGEVIETQEFTLNLSLLYTTPEEIVNAAYALASGESLDDPYTLTGVITKITEAYTAHKAGEASFHRY